MDFERGAVIDNCRLLARVGAGSCGIVWQAENIVSGEIEALKILSDNSLAERELRALRLYREIDHKNLIRIRHVGKCENTFFYTMDWCETSLAEKRVSASELYSIAKKLTSALSLLHSKGLLHRDIKPANIFFRNGEPVLGDIGLLTTENGATIAGSPGFLSPSILSGTGTADKYSDCYALAKSLYCALSGFGPEKFPCYKGELTEEASVILRSTMAVCGSGTVDTAEKFFEFLNAPLSRKSGKLSRGLLAAAFCTVVISFAVLGAYHFSGSGADKKNFERKTVEKTSDVPSPAETVKKSFPTERKEVAPAPIVDASFVTESPSAPPVAAEKTTEESVSVPRPSDESVPQVTKETTKQTIKEGMKESEKEISEESPWFSSSFKPESLDEIPPEKYTTAQRKQRVSNAISMSLFSLQKFYSSSSDYEAAKYGLTKKSFKVYDECVKKILKFQENPDWERIALKVTFQQGKYTNLVKKTAREKKDPVKELQNALKNDKIYAVALASEKVYKSHMTLIDAINNGEGSSVIEKRLEKFKNNTEEYTWMLMTIHPSDLELR